MIEVVKRCFPVVFVCCSWLVTAQESYTLSAESVMTIAGTSTVHDWEVATDSILGSLTTTDAVISALKIEVPVAAIKSERGPTMDNKMYAALKAEENPSIHFTFKEGAPKGALLGMLVIAGVEQELRIESALVRANDKISISGTQDILLKDYGMEPPTAMFGQIVVGESVTVKFDLVFVRD